MSALRPTAQQPRPPHLSDRGGPPGPDRHVSVERVPGRRAASREVRTLPEVVLIGAHRYRVVRAWPRGAGQALVELAADDGTTVAARWFADPEELRAAAAATSGGVVGDLLLQPAGSDPRLRALPEVLAADGARLVVHRPGRRAVVRVEDAGGDAREFVKVVRPSRAADLARRGRAVSTLIGDAVRVPRLLETSDPERGVLRWSVVPGRTLHDLGADGTWGAAAARSAWEAAGRSVSRLHAAPQDTVAARHGADEELGAITDWLHPAVAHGLLDADLIARAGDEVSAALEAGAAEPDLGVLHRDLHDKQLLLNDDGTVGMIDVDTLALGERALDVANLLVHLELRQAQGLLTAELAAAAREGFLAGLGADLPPERVAAYTRATRLRLAGVYAFRPRWRPVARDFLRQAALS